MPKDKLKQQIDIDTTKLTPKEEVMSSLIKSNPGASKAKLARKAQEAGIYKHHDSGRLLINKSKDLTKLKQQVDSYILTDVVAPALDIHNRVLNQLSSIPDEELIKQDLKVVYEAEKLRPQQIDITVEETVKVSHIHALLSDIDKDR